VKTGTEESKVRKLLVAVSCKHVCSRVPVTTKYLIRISRAISITIKPSSLSNF
jgi:hypothetical protein